MKHIVLKWGLSLTHSKISVLKKNPLDKNPSPFYDSHLPEQEFMGFVKLKYDKAGSPFRHTTSALLLVPQTKAFSFQRIRD